MKEVDLIIFDLDGTLVDSCESIASAVNDMLRKLNLREKTKEEIRSYIGTGVIELIKKSLGDDHADLLDKGFSIFDEYYKNHPAENSKLYPGVKDILEYFKNKIKLIITNRNIESAKIVLKEFGIYDYFKSITGGDDPSCAKPNSCPLDNAISKLDINKDRVIIVGDMDIDVLAGKAAGIATCAVTYGIGKKEDIVKINPDYLIDNISKLKEIVI